MPSKKQPQATPAEVAAYCNSTPEAIEMLAEMLPHERAEFVYSKLHPSTPILRERHRIRTVLAHAFAPTQCAQCELPASHAAHSAPIGTNLPYTAADCVRAFPRFDELRDVLGMLSAADEELSAYRNETAQQTLRDAIALLRSELGPHAQRVTLPQKK